MKTWQTIVGAGLLSSIVGCGANQTPTAKTDEPTPSVAVVNEPSNPATSVAAAPIMNLDMPFSEATTTVLPDGFDLPPETTLAGKSSAKLADDVRKLWSTIRLTDATGQPATVRATIVTDAGKLEISFFPSVAPNHVRNFLALAKAEYFDGLVFERVVQQVAVAADGSQMPFEFLTAGCPIGDGSRGRGHLGYFVKPEVSDIVHTEGTVGVWREEDDNSASTRFYITLGPAPTMDQNYTVIGKVTLGMETLRTIADAPPRLPGSELPAKPTKMQSVRINP